MENFRQVLDSLVKWGTVESDEQIIKVALLIDHIPYPSQSFGEPDYLSCPSQALFFKRGHTFSSYWSKFFSWQLLQLFLSDTSAHVECAFFF